MWKQLIMTAGAGVLLFQGQTVSANDISPQDLVHTEESLQQTKQQVKDTKQSIQAIQTKLKQVDHKAEALRDEIEGTSIELEKVEEDLVPTKRSFFSKVVSSVLPSAKAEAADAEEAHHVLVEKKEQVNETLKQLKEEQLQIEATRQDVKTSYDEKSKQYKQQTNQLSNLKKQYEAMAPDRFLMPAEGRLSQGFGAASGQFGYTFHNGLDIAAKTGTPIYAAEAGTVTKVSSSGPYGNHIQIEHNVDGQKWTTVYAHMHKVDVKKGQTVRQGEPIGQLGNTGNSSGSHLHFEIHKGDYNFSATSAGNAVNPMKVAERLGGASPVKATF
ncbi:peptidoglycan DD-metalloendopeptidase family protein [Exiguobacterium marinum]|uniref:Peptidoglycan DD-metalloendopeptidase family protein n=1 Tax=Exiguobacterium marinum TaxID=273528 RepID=A0ABY7WZ40_9BACL|nr:M23 family metallopeptidase [Exiguobacterium marinum]WDH75763.1 peptidoglycan DD-metalloendopeptidase family protein [Exiguobacterium marinum]